MLDLTPTLATTRSPDEDQHQITSPIGTRPLLRANMHPPPVQLKQSLLPFSTKTPKSTSQQPTTPDSAHQTQPTIPLTSLDPSQLTSGLGLAVDPPTLTHPTTQTLNAPSDPLAQPSTSALPLPQQADVILANNLPPGPAPRRLGPGGVALLAPAPPYHVCAFCMGPATKNKFGRKEAMVSCYECGSSGHPSCCGFDDERMVRNVKSYHWCCGDCTRCEVCDVKGEDNDDTVSRVMTTRLIRRRQAWIDADWGKITPG